MCVIIGRIIWKKTLGAHSGLPGQGALCDQGLPASPRGKGSTQTASYGTDDFILLKEGPPTTSGPSRPTGSGQLPLLDSLYQTIRRESNLGGGNTNPQCAASTVPWSQHVSLWGHWEIWEILPPFLVDLWLPSFPSKAHSLTHATWHCKNASQVLMHDRRWPQRESTLNTVQYLLFKMSILIQILKTYSLGLIGKMKKTTCKLPFNFRWWLIKDQTMYSKL